MTLAGRAGGPAPALRAVFVRHATAWLYLVGVCLAELGYVLLRPPARAALLRWASTSVQNLTHHPVASLIASAFFPTSYLLAWPILIALALFGATSALGNWRAAVTCVAGQVVGTAVSEGIVGYRVAAGSLPHADRFLLDVGPSYVVVAAIAVGLLHGGWLVRAAAALDLALLVFVGQIFAGLSRLEVAPVGHLTALITGMVVGTLLARRNSANSPGHYQIKLPYPGKENRQER
jgi:hypothetical protein